MRGLRRNGPRSGRPHPAAENVDGKKAPSVLQASLTRNTPTTVPLTGPVRERGCRVGRQTGRLLTFTQQMAFFITRAKSNLDFRRGEHRGVDKSSGLRSDYTITLQGPKTSQLHPTPLRRIVYYDAGDRGD